MYLETTHLACAVALVAVLVHQLWTRGERRAEALERRLASAAEEKRRLAARLASVTTARDAAQAAAKDAAATRDEWAAGRDRALAELETMAAANAASRAGSFDAALTRVVDDMAEPGLSALLEAVRKVVSTGIADASKLTLNGQSQTFRRMFSTPASVSLLEAIGFAQGDDGRYRVAPTEAAHCTASGFYAATVAKLASELKARRGPLAAALGWAYFEHGAVRGGRAPVSWEPYSQEIADTIFEQLTLKMRPDESPAACAERLARAPVATPFRFSLPSDAHGPRAGRPTPYYLYLGPHGECKQQNGATMYSRSVSFFTARGPAYNPPQVHSGDMMFPMGSGATRQDDRDQTASREATLEDSFPAPLFESLDAASPRFAEAAALLRASLAPAEADVAPSRGGLAALTSPPVVVVAVHAVRNDERAAYYGLARTHLVARGEAPNETRAFHGTTLGACAPICRHGFVLRDRNASQFGVGAYFSPAGYGEANDRSMMALDEKYASPDKTGLQHLLLVSVLRGKSEKLRDGGARGNSQMQPSSPEYLTGLDSVEVENAARLVVWGGILNTHVLIEAVVTVRQVDGYAGDLRDGKDPGADPGVDSEEEEEAESSDPDDPDDIDSALM